MSHFIVREKGHPDRAFSFSGGTCVIGRSEQSDLMLANVSVSRSHVSVRVSPNGDALVEDLGSQNGTSINGEKVTISVMRTGDRLDVGKFSLIYIGSEQQPPHYSGRLLDELPNYLGAGADAANDATFQVPAAVQEKLRRLRARLDAGTVTAEDGQSWRPGEEDLAFGPGGTVPVAATFARGVVARVAWNGSAHVLRRASRLVKVELAGEAVTEAVLEDGAAFTVGNSSFTYQCAG